jgi:hypothetical protein
VVAIHPDDFLGPGGAIDGIVAEARVGLGRPVARQLTIDAAFDEHIALLDEVLALLGGKDFELIGAHGNDPAGGDAMNDNASGCRCHGRDAGEDHFAASTARQALGRSACVSGGDGLVGWYGAGVNQ